MWIMLVDIAFGVLSWVLPPNHTFAAVDRRSLRENRVRSAIRAVSGRVLDIGTEWSAGHSEIGPRRVRFEPMIGIVGSRDIDVVSLATTITDPDRIMLPGGGRPITFLVTTARGDLYWAVPERLSDDIVALIDPASSSSELLPGA